MQITIAPNVHAAPMSPEVRDRLPKAVDEWQYYAADPRPTYGYRAAVEAGAVKEFDCSGERLRGEICRHVHSGAQVIAMDEPLVAAIRPYWEYGTTWAHGHCMGHDDMPRVAQSVAKFIREAKALALRVSWIEAFPQHEMALWLGALELCRHEGAVPDRVVLDYDPYAGIPTSLLTESVAALRSWAETHTVELACIVMGHRSRDDQSFLSAAWNHWRVLHEMGPWDRVVVQSWVRVGGHTIPHTDIIVRIAQQIAFFQKAMVSP